MLVLASQSPRRAELLRQIGVSFKQSAVNIDETPRPQEKPELYVLRMALEKANQGSKQQEQDTCVLGSDTIVVVNGEILGKPKDQEDSLRMLQLLADNTHQVLTAVAVVKGLTQKHQVVSTDVCFGKISQADITRYWHTGEPADKAGSYAIQGIGGQFVKQIQGSYSAVVGLPLYQTKMLLAEFGVVNEC